MRMSEIEVGQTYAMSETNDVFSDPNVRKCTVLKKNVLIEVRDAGVLVEIENNPVHEVVHSRRIKMLWDEYANWVEEKKEEKDVLEERIEYLRTLADGAHLDITVIDVGGSPGDVRVSILANDFVFLLKELTDVSIKE